MFLILSLLACDAGEVAPDACETLSTDVCAERDHCAVIQGAPLDWPDPTACYDLGEAAPQGCQDAELSCPPSIAYGTPGDGTCYEFAAGCLPDGWTACEADPAAVGECP